MRNWYSKNLGDAMLAQEPLSQLEELFSSVHAGAGRPVDMAAFIRHESEGRLHCEVKIYLSPGAVAVAREVNAKPCERPSPDDLGLFAGSEEAWVTLFPGHDR